MTTDHEQGSVDNDSSGSERFEGQGFPLADWCALCGRGYHPNLEITIADEPQEILGEEKFAWSHVQCGRDHDRLFLEALEETNGFEEHFDSEDESSNDRSVDTGSDRDE